MKDAAQQMRAFKAAGVQPTEGAVPVQRTKQPRGEDCKDGLDFIVSQVMGKTLEECAPDLLRLPSCKLRQLLMRFSNGKSS